MTYEDFAQKLRAAREAKGLSQEQLGDLVGVSQQAVTQWEAAETFPRKRTWELLSGALGLGIDLPNRMRHITIAAPKGFVTPPHPHFNQFLIKSLPENLHQYCDVGISYGPRQFLVDYLSPKIIMECGILNLSIEQKLLQLLTVRRTLPDMPDRRSILAAMMMPESSFQNSDLITDAAIHGVEVILVTDYRQIADMIVRIETS